MSQQSLDFSLALQVPQDNRAVAVALCDCLLPIRADRQCQYSLLQNLCVAALLLLFLLEFIQSCQQFVFLCIPNAEYSIVPPTYYNVVLVSYLELNDNLNGRSVLET